MAANRASPSPPRMRDEPPMSPDDFFSTNLLVHTHLEKTAGSSLNHGLAQIFKPRAVVPSRLLREPEAHADRIAAARVLTGHFAFGQHVGRFDRNFVYLALVRDPFERFVSQYQHVQRSPNHTSASLLAGKTLAGALDHYAAIGASHASNYMCRKIGGREADAKTAIARIEAHYLVVAPHERVNDVIARIASWAGVRIPPPLHRNAGSGAARAVPDHAEERRRFAATNREDEILYAHVRDTFDDRFARFDALLERLAR